LRTIEKFLEAPERWYTQGSKEKRSGGRRIYFAPDNELRELQRGLLPIVRMMTPRSPLLHRRPEWTAALHAGRRWFIRLDIRDFHPSVAAPHVAAALDRLGADPEVREIVLGLTTLNGRLVQGAPTSPGLADLILSDVDASVFNAAQERGVFISRWSDDVGVSGDDRDAVEAVAGLYEAGLARLDLRWRRTDALPLNLRRKFLGFYVNSRLSVPGSYRKKLMSAVRSASHFGCTPARRESLLGKISYIAPFHRDEAARLRAALRREPRTLQQVGDEADAKIRQTAQAAA
jgi:hypothetical protein